MKTKDKLPVTNLVIFGITGDLSSRYILPALAQLKKAGRLPSNFKIVGLSRRPIAAEHVLDSETACLGDYLVMLQMDVANDKDYEKLKLRLGDGGQVIFYFAVPPTAVLPIVHRLNRAKLNGPKTKLLLEKPFGYDLESAKYLVAETTKCFKEKQIYRIDHYMAKEMAQNISVFLGSNSLFRQIWNSQFIDSIDILSAEKIGIEGRTNFYESTGALRDFVQSHLMNLAALTLMRPCSGVFEFSELPERRLEALKSLRPIDQDDVVRAQYSDYKEEVSNPKSNTETFVSLKLHSQDSRWAKVPITLTTGKKLDQKLTEIRVSFKKTDDSEANTLILRIQPEEGIELDLWTKTPGYDRELRRLPLKFSYAEGAARLPNAYEQVLVDAMRGSQSLFASSDEVLETWRILQPVIDCWSMSRSKLHIYEPGSTVEQVLAKHV